MDPRRDGPVTVGRKATFEIAVRLETDRPERPLLRRTVPHALEVRREAQALAVVHAPGAAGETAPRTGVVGGLRQQHLDRGAAGAAAVETRRHDLGIVHDYDVAGTQPLREIAHRGVRGDAAAALHHHQAAAVTLGERMLRDLRRIERIVERRRLHGRSARVPRRT